MIVVKASANVGIGGGSTYDWPEQPALAKKTGGGDAVSGKPAAGSTGMLTTSFPSLRTTRAISGDVKMLSSSTTGPTSAPFASTTKTPGPVAPGAPCGPEAPKSARFIARSFFLQASRMTTAPVFFVHRTAASAVSIAVRTTPTASNQPILFIGTPPIRPKASHQRVRRGPG